MVQARLRVCHVGVAVNRQWGLVEVGVWYVQRSGEFQYCANKERANHNPGSSVAMIPTRQAQLAISATGMSATKIVSDVGQPVTT
jgi:hypothetical protein